MGTNWDILNTYRKIFEGNNSVYGTYIENKDKLGGRSSTINKLLTEKEYRKHLNGEQSLGIVPIDENNECKFCVADVDDNKTDHTPLIERLYDNNSISLLPFRSKSGGLHLYLFFHTPISAEKAVNSMKNFLAVLGLPSYTEVFPKQIKLKEGQVGSWINLPYFNAYNTKRYLIGKNNKEVIFEKALEIIKDTKIKK